MNVHNFTMLDISNSSNPFTGPLQIAEEVK